MPPQENGRFMSYISFRAQKQRDSYFVKKNKTLNWDANPRYPDIFSSFPTSFALDHPNVSPCGCFFAQKAIADSFVKDWTGPGPAEHDQVLSIVLPIVSKFSIWVSVETPMNQPIVSFGWLTLLQLGFDGSIRWTSKRITVTFLTDGLRGLVEGLGQRQSKSLFLFPSVLLDWWNRATWSKLP